MNYWLIGSGASVGLFFGIIAFMELGHRIGRLRPRADLEGARAGIGAVEGAIFALLGLLIAFTFSDAASRFDRRRQLVAEETNAIGTAWLRLDMLAADAQPALRADFRRYLDTRIEVYRNVSDLAGTQAKIAATDALQRDIWTRAVAACKRAEEPQVILLVLPAMNLMFDLATARVAAMRAHEPLVIYLILGVLALVSALVAGVAMAPSQRRSTLHILVFAGMMALTIYTMIDLEFPRQGLIRLDAADRSLLDLRRSMD